MMKLVRFSQIALLILPLGLMNGVNLAANALTPSPASVAPSSAIAQTATRQARIKFKVPNVSAPANREGGGTRGSTCSVNHKPMVALLPPTQIGLTISDRPDIFVYVPQNSGKTAEFLLMNEDNTEILYETSFPITGEAGIYKVTVFASAKSRLLRSGENYHWYFSVVCSPGERSGDLLVNGWIKRIEPMTKLTHELKQVTRRDRPNLYANASLWYETLSSLVELRCSNPGDATVKTDWETLLQSVGLEGVSQAPLKQNCLAQK